jgi:hypothetical protein
MTFSVSDVAHPTTNVTTYRVPTSATVRYGIHVSADPIAAGLTRCTLEHSPLVIWHPGTNVTTYRVPTSAAVRYGIHVSADPIAAGLTRCAL